MKEHICNPQAVTSFGRELYQCGCGRYWMDADEAIKQQSVWMKAQFPDTDGTSPTKFEEE